jgi:hypothetical protein
MDYRIRRNKNELDSTGYMEIGPGRYSGQHWQDEFLFVWEDAFEMAEGILAKHFPAYDHLGMNDIPRDIGIRIIAEWREVAGKLKEMTTIEAHRALELPNWYLPGLETEITAHGEEIAAMLRDISDECDCYYRQGDWICILGM